MVLRETLWTEGLPTMSPQERELRKAERWAAGDDDQRGAENMSDKEYLLVAGSRDFTDADTFHRVMMENISSIKDLIIIEGGAILGADAMAARFALFYRVELVAMKADWEKYGRAAGPKRNEEMTKYAAEHGAKALFFWDGKSKGTANCIKNARKRGIPLKVWLIPEGRYTEAEEGTEK